MQKTKFHQIMNVFIVSIIVFFAAMLAANALTNWAVWPRLLLGAAAFALAMIIGTIRIFSDKKSMESIREKTKTATADKPEEKKKFDWEWVQILMVGVPVVALFCGIAALIIIYIGAPIVNAIWPKTPALTAYQTLGNDCLTPHVPPGASDKGLQQYDNFLVEMQPGQEYKVTSINKGQYFTWRFKENFYFVDSDGPQKRYVAAPRCSDTVQTASDTGDLVLKTDFPNEGIIRVYSDKPVVYQSLPLFRWIEKHGLP